MNMLKRGRSKRTYAKMKGSPKYTDTINKRKDVKRKRLYESSVICFNIEKYSVDENIMFMLKSYDDNYYILGLVVKHCEKIVFRVRLLQIE